MAKTRTHHRDGTGCWGREMSKEGDSGRGEVKEKDKERREEKERERRMEPGEGRDGKT